jgi:hypothetical protein
MSSSRKLDWTRAAEAAPPGDPENLDSWRKHRRLQSHADQYAGSDNRGKFLRRYATGAVALKRSILLRCICHVGAWVALLPEDDVVEMFGGRSPALVLAQLLRMRGPGKLTPWLSGVLRLVSVGLREIKHRNGASVQWEDVGRALPQKMMSGGGGSEKVTQETPTSILTKKRALLFHNEVAMWGNCDISQKNERVRQLEIRIAELKTNMDTVKLRAVMRQLVAALSPPRATVQESSREPLSTDAEQRLQCTAAWQRSIREMLVWCIDTWRNYLNLEDEHIQHILTHLRHLITTLEENHGDIQSRVCAAQQWHSLKSVISVHASAVEPARSVKDRIKKVDSACTMDNYQPSVRVQNLPNIQHMLSQGKRLKGLSYTPAVGMVFCTPEKRGSCFVGPLSRPCSLSQDAA